jgi:hypothetical protein
MSMLMKLTMACMLVVPVTAAATGMTYTFNWPDESVGFLGTVEDQMAVTVSSEANRDAASGYGLKIHKAVPWAESRGASGFLAAVWNLQAGDEITASFWRHDVSMSLPRLKLTAHYNNDLDQEDDLQRSQPLQLNYGDLDPNDGWGDMTGWEQLSQTWVIEEDYTGAVISVTIYGEQGQTLMIDDLSVTVPKHAWVRMPNSVHYLGNSVTTESRSLSVIKELFR